MPDYCDVYLFHSGGRSQDDFSANVPIYGSSEIENKELTGSLLACAHVVSDDNTMGLALPRSVAIEYGFAPSAGPSPTKLLFASPGLIIPPPMLLSAGDVCWVRAAT